MGVRKAGVLLHISSLPGVDAVGTIHDAMALIPLLKRAQLAIWQILPIGPTIIGDSPFQGPSVFAGNTNLISLEPLLSAGDLSAAELKNYQRQYDLYLRRRSARRDMQAHYEFLWTHKVGFDRSSWGFRHGPMRAAHRGFMAKASAKRQGAYRRFLARCGGLWLDDYALFMALKAAYGFPVQWSSWKAVDRFRLKGCGALASDEDIEFHKYLQFVFDEQLGMVSRAAGRAGIEIIGDLPIYPAYDSSDVWSNPGLFQLDRNLKATHVACVPPDNFNPKGGQLWGNPLYRWGAAGGAKTEKLVFEWWRRRLQRLFEYHDVIKIDHFRGLVAYGRVSARDKDARQSRWMPGPGTRMLRHVRKRLGALQIIAEDLGVITPAVRAALRELGYPGMRLLQYGDFAQKKNSIHLPDNVPENAVAYTGTHDNPTLVEWYLDYFDINKRARIESYLSRCSNELGFVWKAIDAVLQSKAERAIVPMQDLLELGGEARMNFPSRIGYWRWRMSEEQWEQLKITALPRLRRIVSRSARERK